MEIDWEMTWNKDIDVWEVPVMNTKQWIDTSFRFLWCQWFWILITKDQYLEIEWLKTGINSFGVVDVDDYWLIMKVWNRWSMVMIGWFLFWKSMFEALGIQFWSLQILMSIASWLKSEERRVNDRMGLPYCRMGLPQSFESMVNGFISEGMYRVR